MKKVVLKKKIILSIALVFLGMMGMGQTTLDPSKKSIQAWIYPGDPACDAVNEFTDGRVINTLKPEYLTLNTNGSIMVKVSTPILCNEYSTENAYDVKNYSSSQFITVSGAGTNLNELFTHAYDNTWLDSYFVNPIVDKVNNLISSGIGFTGVELDLEWPDGNWTTNEWTRYKLIIKRLGYRLHHPQSASESVKQLIVVGSPMEANPNTSNSDYQWNYNDFTNDIDLKNSTDFICVMIYDHMSSSNGAVAPLDWNDRIINYIKTAITDNDKIIIGMPSYGYQINNSAISNKTKLQAAENTQYNEFSYTTNPRDISSSERYYIDNNGKKYYYQDAIGLSDKVEFIRSKGIKHVSVWHLGGNDWFNKFKDVIFKKPAQVENAGGSNWTDINNIKNNDTYTTTTSVLNNELILSNFNFSIPAANNIYGIEIAVVGHSDPDGIGKTILEINVSNDNGINYSSVPQTIEIYSNHDVIRLAGAINDTWGLSWNAASVSNNNFKIKIKYKAGDKPFINAVFARVYSNPSTPVTLVPVSLINSGDDDAADNYAYNNGYGSAVFDGTNTHHRFGVLNSSSSFPNGAYFVNGFRFNNIQLSAGSTITKANLNFYYNPGRTSISSNFDINFYAEKNTDAASFSSTSSPDNNSNRPVLPIAVKYTFLQSYWDQNTLTEGFASGNAGKIDLKSIVQPLINSNWDINNNAISLIAKLPITPQNQPTQNNCVGYSTRESSSSKAAKLEIEYLQPENTPTLSYSNSDVNAWTAWAFGCVQPQLSGFGNTPVSSLKFSSVPELPANLRFDSDGKIVGVPVATSPKILYTISVTDGIKVASCKYYIKITNPHNTLLCSLPAYMNGNRQISSNETWGEFDNLVIDKTIEVMPGKTLTINGAHFFYDNSHILVRKGGKLILDGAFLTTLCINTLWQGVIVEGDRTKSQSDVSNHGIVELKNNATIANASIGILRRDFADFNYGGGIIRAYQANFVNNQIAVKMQQFQNKTPNGANFADYSYFRVCNFITNDAYQTAVNYPFYNFIELTKVNGIDIKACKFENKTSSVASGNFLTSGIGIVSINSTFTVDKYYDPATGNQRNCEFNMLKYGIKAISDDISLGFSVKNTIFAKNMYGAYAQGMNNISFISNEFRIVNFASQISTAPDAYGLYLNNCKKGYSIEGNSFSKADAASSDASIGILINSSEGDVKTIYNNSFSNIRYAFLAQNDNGGNSAAANGLKIKCNDFSVNYRDIAISPDYASGISPVQGSNIPTDLKSPAGNTFTHLGPTGTPTDFNNRAANLPIYYHHQGSENDPWVPKYYYRIIPTPVQNTPYNKALACPNIAIPGTGNLDPLYINTERQAKRQLLNSAKLIYTIWVDGGNTQALKEAVDLSFPWQAYELYNNLISKSPYLSDEVIISAIENEEGLPALMLKLVLLANPQATRSSKVWDALYARHNPLPDSWIDEIKQGIEIISPRTELEANIGYYAGQYQQYTDVLKNYYLSDTTESATDSLIAVLSNTGSASDAYELAMVYLNNGRVDDGVQLLENMPNTNILQSEEEIYRYYQTMSYFNIIKKIKSDNFRYGDLSQQELDWIYLTSENDDAPYSGNAKAIRMMYEDNYEYYEPVYYPNEEEMRKAKHKPGETISKSLTLMPNPAKDYTIVNYSISEILTAEACIEIYDALGRMQSRTPISRQSGEELIDCSQMNNGSYLLILKNNGKTINKAKFVVTH